ncbi:ATP-binding cassette domain-containing protein [Corynebacterium sp.]|uniref:ATP-binding cassette domain-containing protein n=1 Tax=Corynebacterium sp. TaxID=1720 RepID=UPI0026DD7135|nr:ATP-binding cassette domain-containing protein [Corynebacterium sp.]MDO5032173.1 ATP-binding cassette domain-containing protein [Corynebacterium sp.]
MGTIEKLKTSVIEVRTRVLETNSGLAWAFQLIRLYPFRGSLFVVLTSAVAVVSIAFFPVAGRVIDIFVATGEVSALDAALVGGIVVCAVVGPLLIDYVVQGLQLDLQVKALEHVPMLVGRPDYTPRAFVSDTQQWWFRECIALAGEVFKMRLTSLVALFFLIQWNIVCAMLLAMAFIVNGHYFQRWLEVEPEDISAKNSYAQDLVSQAHAGRVDFVHLRAFGFLSSLFRKRAREVSAMSLQVRQKALIPLIFSNVAEVVALAISCSVVISQSLSGTVSLGLVASTIPLMLALEGLGPTGDSGVALAKSTRVLREISSGLSFVREDHREANSPIAEPVGLTMKNVTYSRQSEPILVNASLEVLPGELVALTGANGAGKSTALSLCAGLLVPDSGEVCVAGTPVMAFQDPPRFPLPLRDSFLKSETPPRAFPLCELVNFDADPRKGLSGGQWQRLHLVRTLLHAAEHDGAVLLDEPCRSLDTAATRDFFEHLNAIRQQNPSLIVVFSTHDAQETRYADRVVEISGGRFHAQVS